MEKHLLVAVSDQQSAMHGVRFVTNFFSDRDEIKVTLFFTAPKPMGDYEERRDPDAARIARELTLQYEAKGRKAIETAKRHLIRTGFTEHQINSKLQTRRISKVTDLINEGEKGLYDAVVLGRRGLSWLEEAFEDSVSKGLLDRKCNFPLWMCRKSDKGRKNVLVCLDGSEEAFRIADHVGFILEKERGQKVTILTIAGKEEGNRQEVEDILSKGEGYLTKNGFPPELVGTRTIISGDTAGSILKFAEEGKYASVALGRRSIKQGFLKKIFTGSVSSKLFRELEGPSLWICH
jgi:nucleotide-binding universal stress UspA family protein